MAVVWAVVFGSAMHNAALGIGMGLCMGLVFGQLDFGSGAYEEEKTEAGFSASVFLPFMPRPVG